MRSIRDVQVEIQTLLSLKGDVPEISEYQDNHHDAIDSQIEVLETGLTEEDIRSKLECYEWRMNQSDAALEALQWLNEEYPDPPSEDWKILVENSLKDIN